MHALLGRQHEPELAGGVKVTVSCGRLAATVHSRESNFLALGALCSSLRTTQPLFSLTPSIQAWTSATICGLDQVYGPSKATCVVALGLVTNWPPGVVQKESGKYRWSQVASPALDSSPAPSLPLALEDPSPQEARQRYNETGMAPTMVREQLSWRETEGVGEPGVRAEPGGSRLK